MNKLSEEIKKFTVGGINKQIAGSDIDPHKKAQLFSRQVWLSFISWFLRVIVIGLIVICINYTYDSRKLQIVEKNNDFQIELKRYSYSDSIHAKFLSQYIDYEPIQRYRFLNHMRHTSPDSTIRSLYNNLFNQFYQQEGELVKISIASSYQNQANEIDSEVEEKNKKYKELINNQSQESQNKAKQTQEEINNLLAKRDTYEQLANKTMAEPTNEVETQLQSQAKWENRFSLKQSYNTSYFIKTLATNQLIIGLKEVVLENPKSAMIFIRTGSFSNPSFYQEKRVLQGETIDVKIIQTGNTVVPENLDNQTLRIELVSVWKSGLRKWAEINTVYDPNNQ